MEKRKLFFTYLGKLIPRKENPVGDENKKEDLISKSSETLKTENEWLQEYEVIYRSYAIDSY